MKSIAVTVFAWLGATLAIGVGCSSQNSVSPNGGDGGPNSGDTPGIIGASGDASFTEGTAGLALEFPPCVTIGTIAWTVHNPARPHSDRTGSVPASQSRPIQSTVTGLPAGGGYVIKVTTGGSGAACTGTADFMITADTTNRVPVNLTCSSANAGDKGGSCGVATSVSAIPSEVDLGTATSLTACGTNVDGSQAGVDFSWSMTGGSGAGSFDSMTTASPKFTCNNPGTVTVAVTTTSADPSCQTSTGSVTFTCVAPRAAGLSLGLDHTCALRSSGSVACWGFNNAGQLGNGTNKDSLTPVNVPGLAQVSAIAAGSGHTCALLSDGTVSCWGAQRELGTGSATGSGTCNVPCSMSPVAVSGLKDVTAVTSGDTHMCALKSDASIACWGTNESGELGDGTQTDALSPVAVQGVTGATAIAAGEAHTCALLTDGTVKCWGYDYSGQLGNGMMGPDTCSGAPCSLKPVTVMGLTGVTAIAAGGSRTCALLSDGTARCWGFSDVGELGNGATASSSTPVTVSKLSGATALFAGTYHTCARVAGGTIACWGDNSDGQFCNGTKTNSSTPVTVPALSGAATLGTGNMDTCALLSDDTIACCGWDSRGQLGDGTMNNSSKPATVPL